jgi:hypothetical protein
LSISKKKIVEALERVKAEPKGEIDGVEVWVFQTYTVIQLDVGFERIHEQKALNILHSIGLGQWYYDDWLR